LEIAWRAPLGSIGKERDGSVADVNRVDGRETVGNSLGRAPLGGTGSKAEATTVWTEGHPWKYSLGRGSLGRSEDMVDGGETIGKERGGRVDTVDGWETLGNSLGRARWAEVRWKRR